MYNVHYQPYWLNEDELEHYGILGMKWGIRRYQNVDGTLTEAGKKRLENYKYREFNRVSKANTSFQRGVDRRAAKRKRTGAIQTPKQAAHEKKTLEEYKKELKVIKKLSYANMLDEKQVQNKYNLSMGVSAALFGLPGALMNATYQEIMGTSYDKATRKLRLELYDELNKK